MAKKIQKARFGTGFGQFADQYQSGRKGYPCEAFDFLAQKFPKEACVLDIGCGTGIATRELAKCFTMVTGSDIDPRMIEKAKQLSEDAIEYIVCDVKNLPYENEKFDIVCAFSSFHWFQDSQSIDSIRKVLKKSGLFFAVNKKDTGVFREQFRKVCSDICKVELEDPKAHYDPKKALCSNGFLRVDEKIWNITELYSIDEALQFLQSMSIWSQVPEHKRQEVEKACEEILLRQYPQKIVPRPVDITATFGFVS